MNNREFAQFVAGLNELAHSLKPGYTIGVDIIDSTGHIVDDFDSYDDDF